jgi:hypothetical protein
LANELHQEFLLRLCEIGEDKMNEVHEYIDWFCLDVINNIWGKRNRVKCYDNGSTNPLYEFSSSIDGIIEVDVHQDYNIEFDYKFIEAKKILNKDINSDDKDINYKARVFTYSSGLSIENGKVKEKLLFKNALQFSKKSGINYPAIFKAVTFYKKYLKDKLK